MEPAAAELPPGVAPAEPSGSFGRAPRATLPPGAALSGIVRCACCHRSPLIGERVVLHRDGRRNAWLCGPCATAEGASFGSPVRGERIRDLAAAVNVRRIA